MQRQKSRPDREVPAEDAREVYFDKKMPQITAGLLLSCTHFVNKLQNHFGSQKKYKFQVCVCVFASICASVFGNVFARFD